MENFPKNWKYEKNKKKIKKSNNQKMKKFWKNEKNLKKKIEKNEKFWKNEGKKFKIIEKTWKYKLLNFLIKIWKNWKHWKILKNGQNFEKLTKFWKICKILKNRQNFEELTKFSKQKIKKYFWQHIFTKIFQKYSSEIVFYTLKHFHILKTVKDKKNFYC